MKLNSVHIIAALAALLLAGCKHDDPNRIRFDNKLFISASTFTDLMLLRDEVDTFEREIGVGMARPLGHPVSVEFVAAPELLDHYRRAYYDTEAELLPETHYAFDRTQAVIPSGEVSGTPARIRFVEMNRMDMHRRYVLPVTIGSAQGIGEILGSADTFYFVFKGADLINVVADLTQNRAWPEWENPDPVQNLSAFTLETLLYAKKFGKEISTVMGIENEFLVRIGDAGIPQNQIQIATFNQKITSPDLRLETGRWYHLAVTFDQGKVVVYVDGVARQEGSLNTRKVSFGVPHSDESNGKPRCFWIGYSYNEDRFLEGMVSEVRIWNRCLSAQEINAEDHFYKVDSSSEGLVAYWKFDDGAGSTVIRDYSPSGNDLKTKEPVRWLDVTLPEKDEQ